jgi:hypothetical protein
MLGLAAHLDLVFLLQMEMPLNLSSNGLIRGSDDCLIGTIIPKRKIMSVGIAYRNLIKKWKKNINDERFGIISSLELILVTCNIPCPPLSLLQ